MRPDSIYHDLCYTKHWLEQEIAQLANKVGSIRHSAMGRRIDPSWGGPIELFLVPATDPRLV